MKVGLQFLLAMGGKKEVGILAGSHFLRSLATFLKRIDTWPTSTEGVAVAFSLVCNNTTICTKSFESVVLASNTTRSSNRVRRLR